MDNAIQIKKLRARLAKAKGGHRKILEARLAAKEGQLVEAPVEAKAPAKKKKKKAAKKK